MFSLIKPLVVNITILFSLTFNANLFFPFREGIPFRLKQKLIYGLISSFAGILCMMYPIETLGETNFDLRMIMILMATLYGGLIPGLICTLSIILIRGFFIGGSYTYIGILVCVLAFVIAYLFRNFFLRSDRRFFYSLFILFLYLLSYIVVIYVSVDHLNINFYLIYFSSFSITYLALVIVIERMISSNHILDETVYLDKLATVSQMAASFAHEVRNPLTTVRGFIQFLVKDTKDEKLRQYSPLIIEELDRTNKIITNYLTLAKPDAFELEEVDLETVLFDTVDLLRPLASYQGVSLSFFNEGTHRVYVDKSHLKQSIKNLVKNGIEAIDEGGFVKVSKRDGDRRRTVQIIIEDNGKGMTTEELEKVGLPYYTTKTKGTGLGSMISNRLIREMNGTLHYFSEVNTGTKVMITLPIKTK
ncbi:ATP-binding protein [Bacillus sp. DJP31]|uniref:ATP-binding protein n=1 Tax=Bacillus sp. DJP31 TaxID=3409789 RepID=UPI003BB6F8FA